LSVPTTANRRQPPRNLAVHPADRVRVPARRPLRRRLPLLLAATLAVGLVAAASPVPAAATVASGTAPDTTARILVSMNAGRTAAGLVAYRAWGALAALAAERAATMAAVGTLSHDVAGADLGGTLTVRGIAWMGYGEIIARSSHPFGTDAANHVYSMWNASPPHHAIMFSGTYNYVGVGAAQAADGTTWVAAIMTESLDHTAPVASNQSLTRSGRDVILKWAGSDPRLQTHTAGLRSFDVQMRRDNGSWRTVRDNTTSTRAAFPDRARGHWYGFRVQAADRRGTLSPWTNEIRIWVP
jgi:uncharacterized protein YkwD